MSFPFGRPIFALMMCCLLSGGVVMFRQPLPRADLTLWVSADSHVRMYRGALLDNFQNQTGNSVRLDQIATAPMDVRLASLFMFANGQKNSVDSSEPDLVEIDLGSIGKFFRSPAADVGLLPLNDYLTRSGWMSRIVNARFAPWSKDGLIFGVPDDLHPCTITYRKDLFDAAGVDLASAQTWAEFQQDGLAFQKYWHKRGRDFSAIGLSSVAPDSLMVMLRQQHVQLVDADLAVHLSDEKVVRTLCWYAQAMTGPIKIATDLNPATGQNARDLASGAIGSLITPDWMVADLKQYGPDLSGKIAMMPLPRFAAEDARTASWGGTMIGITRTCPHPDLAWRLIESLYLNSGALKSRQAVTGILPPIPQYWTDRVYHQPDPFFAGQKIDEMYIALVGELPETHMTPYTTAGQSFLSVAMNAAVGRAMDGGLEKLCQKELELAQDRLRAMIGLDAGARQVQSGRLSSYHFQSFARISDRRPA